MKRAKEVRLARTMRAPLCFEGDWFLAFVRSVQRLLNKNATLRPLLQAFRECSNLWTSR
ncbi:carbon monoxide dehydrogenase small subunit [Roseibium sp. TrichSKD4]|nr:carbon monoxide dehydrogenase small subunit [Roseibium sp. TrichSKD4]